jgi:hypothetical protein
MADDPKTNGPADEVPAPPTAGGPTAPADRSAIPVCAENLKACLDSAGFWVEELPRYADRQQRRADGWAIAAGVLAAITSLAVWPVVTQEEGIWATAVVSVVAFASALCALVPRIMNYGELAGQARELASRYGSAYGKLIDLYHMGPAVNQQAAAQTISEFESTKAKKDCLRNLPDKQEILCKRALMKRAC